MSKEPNLRWGILGAANIAKSYTKAIRESRNGTLGAIAARDPERARAFAAQEGIPSVAEDYQALLDDPGVDAVYIALPNSLHAEWSIRALRAGKHVLCEKPLATSADEAETMRDAAVESGRTLAEAIMYRLHPVNTTAIGMVREGRIGDLMAANATFFAPVRAGEGIRFSSELGGGSLLDLGVYCVNIIRWAAGEEPVEVRGVSTLHAGGVDLCTSGILKFASGALGTLTTSYATPFACRYELLGRKGRIVCDNGPLCAWPGGQFSVQYYPESGDPIVQEVEPADHYQLMAEVFADAALGRAAMPWSLDESIANLRVLDLLRSSSGR